MKRLNLKLEASLLGFVLGLALWLSGCATAPKDTVNPLAGPLAADRVSIMAYNVENFFDELHDAGKEDFTYLPLKEKAKSAEAQAYCKTQARGRAIECRELNWNDTAIKKKIQAIAQSVKQVHGNGPDILMLEEVENLRIVKRLADEGLKDSGYQTAVVIEGPDKRGVDVGFLSRFPLAGEPKLHQIKFTDPDQAENHPTRGIQEVPVRLPSGQTLYVFGVHLPSQAAPTQVRADAIDTIIKLVQEKGPDALWVVGGDWNITELEDDEAGLISKKMASVGMVSHLIGCKTCRGTHNYRGLWGFLDIFVFSPAFGPEGKSSYALDAESITTPKWGGNQLKSNGRPARFDEKDPVGVSDHLPIYAELKLREGASLAPPPAAAVDEKATKKPVKKKVTN